MPTSVHDLNYITVTGKYEDYQGNPLSGSISFMPSTVLLDFGADVIMMPVTFTATLSGTGSFSIDLPATNDPDITPVGWTYTVQENVPTGRRYEISVPYNSPGGTLSLVEVVPTTASAGITNFVLLNDYLDLVVRVAILESQGFVDGGDSGTTYGTEEFIDGGSPTTVYSDITIDGGSL